MYTDSRRSRRSQEKRNGDDYHQRQQQARELPNFQVAKRRWQRRTAGFGLSNFAPVFIAVHRLTSPAQIVTLRNAGTGAAQITGITLGQPFSQTNDCPALLNPSASCSITVTYTAVTSNDYNTLSIGLNEELPVNVNIYGFGVSSSLALSTTSIQFGNQTVGATGVARIINIQNASGVPTTAPVISISSGFTETDTCKSVLAPGAGCRVSISFVPSGNQNATGTLTANGYGPGGPQFVNLAATGVASGALELSPEL